MVTRVWNGAAVMAAMSGLAAAAVGQSLPVWVVAMKGQEPLQVPAGTVLESFGVPVISPDGRWTAYTGTVSGPDITPDNDEMVFRTSAAQIIPIGREGRPVSGTAGEWLWEAPLSDVRVTNGGRVVFSAGAWKVGQGLLGRGVFSTGTFATPFGLPEQQMVGGAGAVSIGTLHRAPAINTGGTVAAAFTLTGPGAPAGQNTGLWTGESGSAASQEVARGATLAPNTGLGQVYAQVCLGRPRATGDGNVYFDATLSGSGVTPANDRGIWGGPPGGASLVFRAGPSVNPLVSFGQPSLLSAASGQRALFTAKYISPVVTEADNDVLFLATGVVRREIARENQDAPGVPNTRFDWFSTESYVNNRGEVVFAAGLRGLAHPGNDSGIWLDTGSGPQLLVRELDNAPGLPGLTIGQLYSATINNAGQVAFWATLRGEGVNSGNDGCLWVWTPGRGLTLVAREGDVIQLAQGGSRTLGSFSVHMGGPDDGQGTFLSDTGRVVYRAAFTDGSGAIVYGYVAPPNQCYANCDGSTVQPVLNVSDFVCFQSKYAAGDSSANCDGSTTSPVLNVSDFICFQQKYAAGCT